MGTILQHRIFALADTRPDGTATVPDLVAAFPEVDSKPLIDALLALVDDGMITVRSGAIHVVPFHSLHPTGQKERSDSSSRDPK